MVLGINNGFGTVRAKYYPYQCVCLPSHLLRRTLYLENKISRYWILYFGITNIRTIWNDLIMGKFNRAIFNKLQCNTTYSQFREK